MKFETLIKRYKNIGYVPKNVEDEVELECLINWIYKTYNSFIYVSYHDNITIKSFSKIMIDVDYFAAHHIWKCKTDNSNTIYAEKHFSEPFDAKFYAVKELYKTLKFQYH